MRLEGLAEDACSGSSRALEEGWGEEYEFELRFPTLFPPLELLCSDHGQVTNTPQSQEKQHICSFSSVALLQAFNHLATKNYGFATFRDIALYFRHGVEAAALFGPSCVAMAVQR